VTNRIMLWDVAVAVTFTFLCGVALADTKAPGPLGLPSVETLKEKLTLTADQAKKVETIYEEYKDKAKEVEDKGDPKKKAEVRHEIVVKIKEVCTGDQKKKLEEIVSEKEKK
jgi:hypothetical protein